MISWTPNYLANDIKGYKNTIISQFPISVEADFKKFDVVAQQIGVSGERAQNRVNDAVESENLFDEEYETEIEIIVSDTVVEQVLEEFETTVDITVEIPTTVEIEQTTTVTGTATATGTRTVQ